MLASCKRLHGYTIQDRLGEGGFGITYLARDNSLDRLVAIKEFLPREFAHRDEQGVVVPNDADSEAIYEWGLHAFIQEARTLARFDHPNIVKILHFMEANGTAYLIMAHESGTSLAEIYAKGEGCDQAFLENIFFPILDGLEQVHQLGFIHRDIKPANIMVRSNGSPVLIDFGSARSFYEQEQNSLTSLVSRGYTPVEQYDEQFGQQGPWTDIYSLAISLHEGVHGRLPRAFNPPATGSSSNSSSTPPANNPDAEHTQIRHRPGRSTPKQIDGFSPAFLRAVDAGHIVQPTERPQSLGEWREGFVTSTSPNATQSPAQAMGSREAFPDTDTASSITEEKDTLSVTRRRWLQVLSAGGLAAVLFATREQWLLALPLSATSDGDSTVRSTMSNWERVVACFRSVPRVQASLQKQSYVAGEAINLRVNVPEPGYLHAVGISSEDNVTLLFPNQLQTENRVDSGWLNLPGSETDVWTASEPWGSSMILVIYSKQSLDLEAFGSTADLVAELERLSDNFGATEGLSSVSLIFETCLSGENNSGTCG